MNTQYSILRFSPVPERAEFVNVALVFSDARVGLVYDEQFPKLACIAPHFDKDFLVEYMHAVVRSAAAKDFAEAAQEIHRQTAQFRLTEARALTRPLTAAALKQLKTVHLARARHTHHDETAAERRRLERKLDNFLADRMPLDSGWLKKKARPTHYLSDAVLNRLRDKKFTVARVVDTASQLIALDGIDLDLSVSTVEQRAVRVSFAYDMLEKVEPDIRAAEGRNVYRAALVFGEPKSAKQEHAVDLLTRHATAVFTPNAVPLELTERLREAAALLPSVRP